MANRLFFFGSVVFWGLIVACSLLWNIYTHKNSTFRLVNSVGQAFFKEIETTRLWNARHGGVYVPVTERTQPNPYLDVPNRDLTSTQGLKLTLINPAYMTRQIAEIARNEENFQYHITSLKTIRPQNKADEWEIKALTAFENGSLEYMEYVEKKLVFRYMAPLLVKKACLKCHAKQGYKTGDIRGGISVTLPAIAYIDAYEKSRNKQIIVHSVFFLAGVMAFYWFIRFRDHQLVILNKKHLELKNEIANRVQAEETLKISEEKYRTVIENANEAIVVLQDNQIKYFNSKTTELSGYEKDELPTKPFFDIVHPEDRDLMVDKYLRRLRGEIVSDMDTFRITGKQGHLIWVEIKPVIIHWEGTTATLCFIADITDRVLAEAAQRESEEKFRLISEQSLLGISIFQDGVYKYVNDATSQICEFSVEEMMGWQAEEFSKLIHPDDLDFVMSQFRKKQAGENGYITNYTYRGLTKSGKIKWIEQYSKTISFQGRTADLVTVIDITERKHAEELIIQSEKMMSVGGLAAGMAHEINNPLGGILQGTQNIQRRLSPDLKSNLEPAKELGIDLHHLQSYMEIRGITTSLKGIQESGKKAAQIITNMLQFSRRSESKKVPTHLVELMEAVLELAGKDYNLKKKFDFRSIKVIKEFASDLPLVPCIKNEIEQVVLNLLNNAAWATANNKDNSPSQIILRISVVSEMAQIEVEDNGPGMDETTRKRIFEPFFTTKPVGEGTGLGLSVSYMIITNNHKGTMEVESEPGSGTKFIVRLPL